MADNSNNQQPGLVGGHAQYVKGAAEVSSYQWLGKSCLRKQR